MFPYLLGFDGVMCSERDLMAVEDVGSGMFYPNCATTVLFMGIFFAFGVRETSFDLRLVLVK